MKPPTPNSDEGGIFSWLRKKMNDAWFGSVVGAALAVLGGFIFYNPHLGQPLINASYDLPLAYHPAHPPPDVVIVYVDEESSEQLGQQGQRPWDRSLHARLLERLKADGASAVAFDFVFSKENAPRRPSDDSKPSSPADRQADEKFAAAIRAHGKVVIGSHLMHVGSPQLGEGLALEEPAEILGKAAAATGVLEVEIDMDTTVRRLHPILFRSDGTRYTTLDWEAARLVRAPLTQPPGIVSSWWVNYYGPPGTIPSEPYYRALQELPAGYFKNKAVLVGEMIEVSTPGAKADTFRSPFKTGKPLFNGAEVHATILQNLIRNEWLSRASGVLEIGLLALLGIVIGVALPRLRPLMAVAAAVAAMTLAILLAFALHWQARIWFPWMIPVAIQAPVALLWALSFNASKSYAVKRRALQRTPGTSTVALEGQTFAGYEIVAKLGQGGMGTVYKARQPLVNRFIALKVLPAHLAEDGEFVARFQREAAAAANLSHPNMVQVYAAGVSDGTHYFAMEFVDGDSLQKRLVRQGRLAPDEALAICHDVADALKHAWGRLRIIHRDIKPGNVFLSKTGEVKLGDLGLVKVVGGETTGLTQTGTPMGSPHYVSPEQATGVKDIDFHADIYSLGCTLYHLVAGRTPYDGDNSVFIMAQHVTRPPPAILETWPQCPLPLVSLIDKMLKKNPRERHASYEELIAEIETVREKVMLAPKPALSAAASTPEPQAMTAPTVVLARKSPVVVYVVTVVAALAMLGGAWWWVSRISFQPVQKPAVHEKQTR